MKTLILAMLWLLSLEGFAQGTFIAENRSFSTVDAPVSLNGTRATGTQLHAQFYAGPEGAPDSALLPVGLIYTFGTGTHAGYLADVNDITSNASDSTTVPGVPGGANATIELRAWSGTAISFSTATGKGSSAPITIVLGGVGSPPTLPGEPAGLQGFALIDVSLPQTPEPSTAVIAGLGVAALLFRRRKQA